MKDGGRPNTLADTSLETELWAIYRELTIILEKNLQKVAIESDSSIAMNLINEGAAGNHPQNNVINDAKTLLTRTESSLTHIYRNKNECADHLAKMRAKQDEQLILTEVMPFFVREHMIRDCLNIRQVLH